MAYTYRTVSPYKMPGDTVNWRTFRILGWGAIILLVGICVVAIYEPIELGDSSRRLLAWTAGAIVLSAVVLAMVLPSWGSLRKLKGGQRFELFLSLVLLIVPCIYLFNAHNRGVVLTAGAAVLLLQGVGFYSIWRLRKNLSRPNLLLVLDILFLLVTAWIVYERTTRAMPADRENHPQASTSKKQPANEEIEV
jgi:hypothetical protein